MFGMNSGGLTPIETISPAPHTTTDWALEPDIGRYRRAVALLQTDKEKAFHEFAELAELGSVVSMIVLGSRPGEVEKTEEDMQRSEYWLRRASHAGSVEGTYRLGLLYVRNGEWDKAFKEFSDGVEKDFALP